MDAPKLGRGGHVAGAMRSLLACLITMVLLSLTACGDLPPGRVPYQPNAQQGGGDANFNYQRNVGQ